MVLEAPDMAQKILIVDDEQEVLSMLRRCFLLEGYEVITQQEDRKHCRN